MRTYELMTIHRPEMAEPDARRQSQIIKRFLTEEGASVSNVDFWGKRRLAYEIDKANEGYYTVMIFDGDPHHITALDRALSLSDTVMRHKIIRPDVRPARSGRRDEKKGK
jgi:small subunit ribosomal protein S6